MNTRFRPTTVQPASTQKRKTVEIKKKPRDFFEKSASFLSLSAVALTVLVPGLGMNLKTFILIAIALSGLALLAIFIYKRRVIEIAMSPFTLPLFLLLGTVLASSLFTTNYPIKSFLGTGGLLTSLVLLTILAGTFLRKVKITPFITTLAVTASLLTLTSFLQLVGIGPAQILNQVFNLSFPSDLGFNLAGSSLVAIQVIALSLIAVVFHGSQNKAFKQKSLIFTPILLIGLAIHFWSVLPGKTAQPILPSHRASWSVMLESLHSPRSALLGFGPESYPLIYSRFKPAWVNGTENWNIRFASGSNLPITLVSTIGLLGFAAWVILVLVIIKQSKNTPKSSRTLPYILIASLLLQLFFPANIATLVIQFVALSYWIASQRRTYTAIELNTHAPERSTQAKTSYIQFMPMVFSGAVAVAVILGGYTLARGFGAYAVSFQANQAAQENDVAAVYEKRQQAIQLAPSIDFFRRQYVITNLFIASNIASNQELTPTQQTQLAQLIKQSVREARSATVLEPMDSQNWQILAQIYADLINSDESAQQLAITNYISAIETDPTNPVLRIEFGMLLARLELYPDAASLFNQAIQLKPDLPGGHYQLALLMERTEQFPQALLGYQNALRFLPTDAGNRGEVESKIEELQAIVEESAQAAEATAPESQPQPTTPPTPSPSLLEENVPEPEETAPNLDPPTEPLTIEDEPTEQPVPIPSTE